MARCGIRRALSVWEGSLSVDKKQLFDEGRRCLQFLSKRQIGATAAGACFFLVLAFFPTLVLLLGLVRYTGYSVASLTELLDGVIPAALFPAAEKLIHSTYRNTSGTVVSVSALTALWSASRGVYGVLTGLNGIYDAKESRGWFYTRTVSLGYTFAFLLVLFMTLVFHVFGKSVSGWLIRQDGAILSLLGWVVQQRFLLLLFLQTALFTLMYMFLPDRKNKFSDSFPGAFLSAIGWQLVSLLFSVYVENFTAYANIYGSVYAVALCLLWLYLCVSILFYGAAINRWLKEA